MPSEKELKAFLEMVNSSVQADAEHYVEGGHVAKVVLKESPFQKTLIDSGRAFMQWGGDAEAFTSMFLTGFQMGRYFEGRHKEALDVDALRAEIDAAVPRMVLR